jgi:hypothetical protein
LSADALALNAKRKMPEAASSLNRPTCMTFSCLSGKRAP